MKDYQIIIKRYRDGALSHLEFVNEIFDYIDENNVDDIMSSTPQEAFPSIIRYVRRVDLSKPEKYTDETKHSLRKISIVRRWLEDRGFL